MRPHGRAGRPYRRVARRPDCWTSPPPWKRTTGLRTTQRGPASAVARQAGQHRAPPPPRRIRPPTAAPGRPVHMGRDRRDAHCRRRMPGARVLHPTHRRHRCQGGRTPNHGAERAPGGAGREPGRTAIITAQERRRRGQRSLTNIIRIVSRDWRDWPPQGPIPVRHEGGFKMRGSQKIEHHGYRFISRGKASLGHSRRSLFL
jgi:hypothetical protein